MKGNIFADIKPLPYDPSVKGVQIMLAEFCSDSRNSTVAYYHAKEEMLSELKGQGILVDFDRINSPGTYMTQNIFETMKRHVLEKQARYSEFIRKKVPFIVNVHGIGHGHVRRKEEFKHQKTFEPGQLDIINCCTNCGMMHAKDAAAALQNFILGIQPTFTLSGAKMPIKTADNLRGFMRHAYRHAAPVGWDGDLLTWIRNIEDIRSHPAKQIEELDAMISSDPALRGLNISTFAEVLNYTNNGFYRVDGKKGQEDIFLRPIYKKIRAGGVPHDHEPRISSQNSPTLVISDYRLHQVRSLALQAVLKEEGYPAGRIFSITADNMRSGMFDIFSTIGIFYALSPACLNKKDYGQLVVLGRNEYERETIMAMVSKDNIVHQTVKYNAKEYNSVVVADSRKHFPHKNPNVLSGTKQKIIQ